MEIPKILNIPQSQYKHDPNDTYGVPVCKDMEKIPFAPGDKLDQVFIAGAVLDRELMNRVKIKRGEIIAQTI